MERAMTVSTKRRDELVVNALVLAIEVLNRLCPEGDLEDDALVLKQILDERDLDPQTLAGLQWAMRDALDLPCGKEEV
jgi:hypothetical protein